MTEIYADGACEGNQFEKNIGGWAFFIPKISISESGAERNTTNNKMELTSCIKALQTAIKYNICPVKLYTDSEYVVKGMNEWRKGWIQRNWRNSKGETVKNKDLWQSLIMLNEKCPSQFIHVKGHFGDIFNEKVDRMAVEAIHRLK